MANLIQRVQGFLNPPIPVEQKSKNSQTTTNPFFASAGQAFSSSLTNQQDQLRAYTDWVYGAVHAIAEDVASIDYRLYINRTNYKGAQIGHKLAHNPQAASLLQKKKIEHFVKKGRYHVKELAPALEEIEGGHPLLDILHTPNPFMTKDEFWELVQTYNELSGESFIAVIKENNIPVALYPLFPQNMVVLPDPVKFIFGYMYYAPNGSKIALSPDEVIHFKSINPLNQYRGLGVVQAAARAIDTDSRAADYNRNFFYNNARPDGVIQVAESLDDKAYLRLKQEWNDVYGGQNNSHKTAILEQGTSYQQISLSQQDMDFLEGRKFNRDEILALFRVSPSILGMAENVNRANAEAAEFTFAKRVIKPKMLRLANRLTSDLAIMFDPKLVVSFTDPVPEDKAFQLQAKTAAVNKWSTIDEVRAMDGDEPLPNKAGESLYLSNTLIPIDQVLNPPEPVAPQPLPVDSNITDLQDPEDDDQGTGTEPNIPSDVEEEAKTDKKIKDAVDKAIAHVLAMQAVKEVKKPVAKMLYITKGERKSIGDGFVHSMDSLATMYEQKFSKVARSVFNTQKDTLLSRIPKSKAVKKDIKSNIESWLKDLFGSESWTKGFQPIYEELMSKSSQVAIKLIADYQTGQSDDSGNDVTPGRYTLIDFKKYIDERGPIVAATIDDETAKQLRATLTEGLNAGEGYTDLAARVETTYGAASGYRAERIARTESISAANTANIDAWQSSGVVEAKEWYTDSDANTCPFCDEMDGKIIGLSDNYFEKGSTMSVVKGQDGDGKDITQNLNLDFEDVDAPPLHVSCRCTVLPVLINT